jgi:hypothetical protein
MENNYGTSEFVLVFKTNINCHEDLRRLAPIMDSDFGSSKWSVDLSDVDNVLRIESTNCDTIMVIEKLVNAGFTCEELLD